MRIADGGEEFGTFVIGALAATPQVTGIGHILPDGTMRRHNRDDFGRYVEDRGSVPGVEELLDQARGNSAAQWFSPTWSPILQDTILRLAKPLVDQDAASRGVVAAAITTSSLSAYLARMRDWSGPTAFILADQDLVIAHPNKASSAFSPQLGADKPLPRIDEVNDPIPATIWSGERNPLMRSMTSSRPKATGSGDRTARVTPMSIAPSRDTGQSHGLAVPTTPASIPAASVGWSTVSRSASRACGCSRSTCRACWCTAWLLPAQHVQGASRFGPRPHGILRSIESLTKAAARIGPPLPCID